MLCDICHEKPARIFYTEIINGVKKEQHLCEECAAEHTVFSLKDHLGMEIPVGNILTGILNNYTKSLTVKPASEIICDRCRMKLSEVMKNGKMGCPECYNSFALFLDKNLKTIHGANEHKGKEPLNADKLPYKPRGLKKVTSEFNNDAQPSENKEVVTISDILGESGASEPAETKKPAPKSKAASKKPAVTVEALRKAMNEAAEAEDYAEAARMRDLLHALEAQQKKASDEKPKKKPRSRAAAGGENDRTAVSEDNDGEKD